MDIFDGCEINALPHGVDNLTLHLFMVEGGVDIGLYDEGQLQGISPMLDKRDNTHASLDA